MLRSIHHPSLHRNFQRCARELNFSRSSSNAKKYAKTTAGSGNKSAGGPSSASAAAASEASMIPRGPVSWASLGLVALAAASAVSYYQIERERRLENAMGKIVSDG